MRDLICDVTYFAKVAMLRYGRDKLNDVTAPSFFANNYT